MLGHRQVFWCVLQNAQRNPVAAIPQCPNCKKRSCWAFFKLSAPLCPRVVCTWKAAHIEIHMWHLALTCLLTTTVRHTGLGGDRRGLVDPPLLLSEAFVGSAVGTKWMSWTRVST